jgi:hypothetical protein
VVSIDPNVCVTPTTFTAPASQTNPAVYKYAQTPLSFVLTPYTIAPANCVPTYACQMAAGSTINICAVNNGSSVSTFNTATASYTLVTQDAQTYPPGVYNVEVVITVGNQQKTASFQVTLDYPPYSLLASPFADYTQDLGSPDHKFSFDPTLLATPLNLLNQGLTLVSFASADGSPLDSAIFTVSLDSSGRVVSPLILNQISDIARVGKFQVVYTV